MGRAPCCDTSGLKKGPWTPEEDQKLIDYIQKNGYGNWRTLPKNAGLQRCGKSCRLRWINYLRPDIKRGQFSFEEEETIVQLHSILGNKWSAIAARLPGRTDNEIKNYWNTHIRKRLLRMGIDPVTHSPRLDLPDLSSFLDTTNMYHSNQSSASIDPELLCIATSLMSQSQTNNEVGDLYGQTQFDPTQLLQVHYFNQNKLQQDHHNHDQYLNQSLIQLQALKQQLSDYVPVAHNLTHDQLTGLYCYGSEPDQRQSIGPEQSSSGLFTNQISMLN